MKTVDEIKEQIASSFKFDSWRHYYLYSNTDLDKMIEFVAKAYACEVLDYTAEKARTIGVNCDGELIDKSSILNIKEEINGK